MYCRRALRLYVAILSFFVAGHSLAAENDKKAPAALKIPDELQPRYKKQATSLLKKDLRGFMSLLALDFVYEAKDASTTDRGPWRRVWLAKFEEVAYDKVAYDVEEIVEKEADRIVLRVRRVMVYHKVGESTKRVHELRLEDTWAKDDGDDSEWQYQFQMELAAPVDGRVTSGASAAAISSPRLARLKTELQAGKRAALEAFWSEVEGKAPLVEPAGVNVSLRKVTFLRRAGDEVVGVSLSGGLPGEGPKPLTRLAKTDVWYRTERLPKEARFTYEFLLHKVIRADFGSGVEDELAATAAVGDPLNPSEFNGRAALALPDAPPENWVRRASGRPAGRLKRHSIESQVLGESRGFTVYLPAGFESLQSPCKVVYLFDGEDYERVIPARIVFDNLIAEKKIPATVGVLIQSQETRRRDLSYSEPMAKFVATELVPWVRKEYRVSDQAVDTVIGGLSLGGAMAVFCASRSPNLFGKVLSQSGSFWLPKGWPESQTDDVWTESGWLAHMLARQPKRPFDIYMEVGILEPQRILQSHRRLHDVLAAKGYRVTYREVAGAHDYFFWRNSIATGLMDLLGR